MQEASLAVVGGIVWGARRATAVAVDGELILAVGTDADIRPMVGRGTRVVEARGGTILPAFNDAHIHFLMGSRGLTGVKSLLLGSVSHEVIQHADRAVVVVPSPDVAESRARAVHEQAAD